MPEKALTQPYAPRFCRVRVALRAERSDALSKMRWQLTQTSVVVLGSLPLLAM